MNSIIALVCLTLLITRLMNMWNIVCTVKAITGLSCPGCGMTRLVMALCHGKVYQAFRYNPFFFVTLPILFIVYVSQCFKYVKQQALSMWLDKFLVAYAVLEIAFGIIRNISVFSWLLPTEII